MTDYRNYSFRTLDIGLDLRDAPDKVGEGAWVRLKNVKSPQEGVIATRDGRSVYFTVSSSPVHTIKRLDDDHLLVGANTEIFLNDIQKATGFSGNPLSLVPFKPALASSQWTYIGDTLLSKKLNGAGTIYKWGITAPTNAASFAVFVGGNLSSSAPGAIVYDWRYTYYSSVTGAESNPSPTADGTGVGGAGRVQVSVNASTDPQVDTIRIYRRGGVNGGTVWRLSVSAPNVSGPVDDNNADSTIALAQKMLLTNDVPFTSVDINGATVKEVNLPYVFGPFVGKYIIACGDPNRPGYVYWTNSESPDGASPANNVSVTSPQEPLLGGLIFGSLPYVFTKEDMYLLDYGGPNAIPTFIGRKTGCGYGAIGPFAICSGPAIFFVGRFGIYTVSGASDSAVSITETSLRPIFRGESVSNFTPIDFTLTNEILLDYAGEELHFIYIDTSGNPQHLIWHTLYQRWKSANSPGFSVTAAYQDENQSTIRLFLGGSDGKVYLSSPANTNDNGTAIDVNVRTGSLDLSMPQTLKEFGNLIVDADPQNGTITVTPYLDVEGTSLPPSTITGNGRQKFPISLSDTYAYSLGVDFAWSGLGKLYQLDVMWRQDEEYIKHWEFPPTTHGMSGWQHVRDVYITLRSTAVVTLTVEVDGVAKTYQIPSTGGLKTKQYVQLNPVKGKVFRYSLDSTVAFNIYGDDCEIRVKNWNTDLGYQLISPFIKLGSDGSK